MTTDNFLVIDTTARDEKQTKKRQIIAEVDWGSAFATIYPKAIYLIESVPFEVQELHFREDEEKVAYVKRVNVDYFTDAISAKGVWILRRLEGREHAELSRRAGRGAGGGEGGRLQEDQAGHDGERGLGRGGAAAAGEADDERVAHGAAGDARPREPSREELIDGLRAVTYLLHHLAPIFLLCDIRDLGSWLGDTTPAEAGAVATRESAKQRLLQAERFNPTIYLYDSHAGGIGLAERAVRGPARSPAPRARDS